MYLGGNHFLQLIRFVGEVIAQIADCEIAASCPPEESPVMFRREISAPSRGR